MDRYWPWIATVLMIVALALGDAMLWGRGSLSRVRAVALTLFYAAMALLFGVAGYMAWRNGLAAPTPDGLHGHETLLRYLTAFFWQFALDLDGVFVYAAVFAHLAVPPAAQRRVLMWGILPALAIRLGLVLGVGEVLEQWPKSKFLISGLLLLAALRMLTIRQENLDPSRNWVLRLLRRVAPEAPATGDHLLTRVGGRLALTPLLGALVILETGDAFVSLDSVPATFSVARDPLLVVAANGFAMLCGRSLYTLLAGVRDWIRFVKIGLATALGYSAVLMSLPAGERPATWASLAVLVISLSTGLMLAGVARRERERADESALGPEADRLAKHTLSRAKQFIILVVGVTLLAIGLLMVVLPGPGLPIVFVGMALLATEFAWARRLLLITKDKAESAAKRSSVEARKHFKPWVLIPMVLGTAAAFAVGGSYLKFPPWGIALAAAPVLLGQLAWGYFTFYRKPRADTPAAP